MDDNTRIISPDPVAEESGMVRIHIPKEYCQQINGKNDFYVYNIMNIPNGIKIGELDLSGAMINPKTMYDDQLNQKMVIGEFDKDYLDENAVKVSFFVGGKQMYERKLVDVDELNNAIDKYNLEHKLTHEAEKSHDQEYDFTIKKDGIVVSDNY